MKVEKAEVEAGCKAIRNIAEEIAGLREVLLRCDNKSLMNDADIQYGYQSLMIRGMGVLLEAMAMLLENADSH